MNKLREAVKVKRFIGGAVIVFIPQALTMVGAVPQTEGVMLAKIGLLLCCAVAITVEVFGSNSTGMPDGADFVATVAGGLTAAVMLL